MSETSPPSLTTVELEVGGFRRAGNWRRDDASGSIRFDGSEPLPRKPGVYAYAVGGVVHYVGSAQHGIHGRLRHYEIAKTLRTAYRVRHEILTLLASDQEVEVFVVVPEPMTLHGLPIDAVAGLEEGLIRFWRPLWNRRSTAIRKVRT